MTRSVLVVEDGETLLRNVSRALSAAGLQVKATMYGEEARAVLNSETIDIMCLDINLPDCHGLDLLTDIRERHPNLPVVVMTGDDCPENKARAEALGVVAFLSKPFKLSELKRLVGTQEKKSKPHARRREAPRLLMYSHDGFGLGHLKRNTNIATRFVEASPDASVLMLAGCPSWTGGELPPGVDYIKLPSIIKVATGQWRPRGLQISAEETKTLRTDTILSVARHFQPDLVLVDHVPTGVWGELVPTLELLKSLPVPPEIVLGLRDILDAPEVVRSMWQDDGTYAAIDEYYDRIFIYGDETVFDAAEHYGLDGPRAAKVEYCGYVTPPRAPSATAPAAIPGSRDKLVVVVGGGGYDAGPMMTQCLNAWRAMGAEHAPEGIFITGPLMPEERRQGLKAIAEGLPVRIKTDTQNMHRYLVAADVVVTMAGYNALLETLNLGKRVLVIPRHGPSAEQRTRARLFSELGLVRMLDPVTATPAATAAAIQELLASPPLSSAQRLPMDGVQRTVQRLRAFLGVPAGARAAAATAMNTAAA